MSDVRCETCPYWAQHRTPNSLEGPTGDCRFNPPVAISLDTEENYIDVDWPTTRSDKWCGKHPQFSVQSERDRIADAAAALPFKLSNDTLERWIRNGCEVNEHGAPEC